MAYLLVESCFLSSWLLSAALRKQAEYPKDIIWENRLGEGRTQTFLTLLDGEGNGNPLQYSCLENPRDGGASWAAVYGVAQSRTQLQQLGTSRCRYPNLHLIQTYVRRRHLDSIVGIQQNSLKFGKRKLTWCCVWGPLG